VRATFAILLNPTLLLAPICIPPNDNVAGQTVNVTFTLAGKMTLSPIAGTAAGDQLPGTDQFAVGCEPTFHVNVADNDGIGSNKRIQMSAARIVFIKEPSKQEEAKICREDVNCKDIAARYDIP
jgi:hypothetical protein